MEMMFWGLWQVAKVVLVAIAVLAALIIGGAFLAGVVAGWLA